MQATTMNVTTSVLFPAELHAQLEEQARAEERSKGSIIRRALRRYLEEQREEVTAQAS